MRLAVLGGSFNPIHVGHLALAEAAHKELAYDTVAVIPAFISPFKPAAESPAACDRIRMIRLAIRDYPYMYCETYETDKQGISYTADTLEYLYGKFGGSSGDRTEEKLEGKIGLIIGEDLADTLFAWKEYGVILERADMIIGRRCGSKAAAGGIESVRYPFTELKTEIPAVSSTEIRFAVLHNEKFEHLVPPPVCEYIVKNGLYRQ